MNAPNQYFLKDIVKHEMRVIRDDGVQRHLRFQRPGTMCMHFDLITWPGHLCYTGDMGTYVFSRLPDMFEFFRESDESRRYQISMSYWAEKVIAQDRDGIMEFSPALFRADVRDYFDQFDASGDGWSDERKADLWDAIDAEVIGVSDDGEHFAWAALYEFEHDGFRFIDWERRCEKFTNRFTWCCCALRWAISVYDAAKADQAAVMLGVADEL